MGNGTMAKTTTATTTTTTTTHVRTTMRDPQRNDEHQSRLVGPANARTNEMQILFNARPLNESAAWLACAR